MISIIVPFYNSGETLERCIYSLISQSIDNIEVILVDNNSTDNSKKICEKFAKEDNRIKYFFNKNSGVSLSRNVGLRESKGEFIMFVDSDDFINESHCDCYLKCIKEENVDCVIGGYLIEKNGKQVDSKRMESRIYDNANFFDMFIYLIENDTLNACWNKLFIRSKIAEFFEVGNSLGEDLIFNIDYFSNIEKVAILDSTTYRYNVTSENSLSRTERDDLVESSLKIIEKETSFFNINIDDYKAKIFNDFFITALYSQVQFLLINEKKFFDIKDLNSILIKFGYDSESLLNNNNIKNKFKFKIFLSLFKNERNTILAILFNLVTIIKRIRKSFLST